MSGFYNRVRRVLVTNIGTANTGTSLPTIGAQDILILTKAMTVATTLQDRFYLAQGITAGIAKFGGPNGIESANISRIISRAYAAPTEEVLNVGPIAAPTNNSQYRLRILLKDDQRPAADARPTQRDFYYVTDSSATALELASNLVKAVNKDGFLAGKIEATLITDGTFTALTNNATVTAGSPTVTSTAHGLVAGDLVRIGSSAATSPVYTVKSITDANTFVLDTTYQGTSGTVTAANIGEITASTAVSIQLTGQPIPFTGIDSYGQVNFTASLSYVDLTNNFSGIYNLAPITVVTAPSKGSGFWHEVRDMEYEASGYDITNRISFPVDTAPALRAASGSNYHIVVIEHMEEHIGDLQKPMLSPCSTVIAFDIAATGTTTKRDAFLTALATVSGKTIESF